MITTTAQIIAKIFDPKQAEKLRGKGVVEKKLDNTTYLIRFSSGKIKVKVTSGTLTPDTVVQVKNRDGKIILQPVSTPGGNGDKIVLTGTKQEATVNKTILALLSIITDSAATKSGDLPDSEYASIVKKLVTILQTNRQIPDLHKILQTTAKKIVNSASLLQGTPDKQVLSDIKILVQSFQQKLVNLCCKQQNSIKLSIPVEQGFILFANKVEAIEWLAKTQPEIDKNAFQNLTLPKSEPVIIRTVNTGDGASLAIVMNKEESALILDTYIHNEAKSSLWETVPTELLFSILESKGSITAETMESIDKILKLYTSSPQIKQTLPPDIAKPVVQQWIALMLDNDTLLQTLTSNEPVHSAEDIVQLAEHDMVKSVPKAALISEIIKDVLTNTINNPDLPKTDVIANAFEKMGYNLEYELAKTASSGTVEKPDVSDSVKAVLLSLLLQTLPPEKTFPSLPAAESESIQEPVKEVQQLRIIESLVQTLMKDVDIDLEKVIAEQEKQDAPQSSEKAAREALQTLKKILGDFIQQLSEDNQKLIELLNAVYQSKHTVERQAVTPQVPIPQPPAPGSDSINQLLSFLLRSFSTIEKCFEALKTTLNSTPSIDTNSAQQLTDTGEKELSIIKEFINQLQDYIKTLSQYKADTLSNISQEVKAKLQIPPFPTAELQTFLENLRNLTVTLEGKPEIETADTQAKPPPSLSVEQLQNQIRSTLQALITSLEQNNQEFMKQLQEYTSDLKPHTQTEINEFASQLSELLKNLSDTVRSDIVDYLLAQEQFKEETPSVNKIELEKLLNTLLQFVEKNRQEIQHYSDILKDLIPSEAKQLINSFLGKTSDIIDRIMAQLEALHKSIKNQPATPLSDIPGQNIFIKQAAADKINSFIKPLDNLLNTLLTTLKPSQTDQDSADQIKTFTDNLYKTIINARNSIFDEIASFTQKAIKDMEGKKGYNISNIYTGIKKLINIVNTFNNNLLSTLSQEKLPIEHAFQNISKSMSNASSYWTGQSNTVLSETEQSISRLMQSLKESLPQPFLQQSISQREPVKEGELPFIKAVQNSISETLDQIKHYSSRVSNDFRSPEFTAVKNLEQQFHSTLKTMESSIKNMVINVRYTLANAEEKLLSSIENLQRGESDQATVSKNIQSIANRLSHDINRLFDSTVKEILTLLEQIGKEVEKNTDPLLRQTNQSVSQMKQEIEQLLRTINRQIDNVSSRTERALDSTLPDGLRQQVETALSRLESMQLLAKPTPTTDGQQQILSLPVKIGEEWTDVNILLIKKRDKKKGKISGNKFAVRMYVSPSQTGSIIVNMNYHKKHKLSVKIEFEKNEARLWFNKHKEQLINGLKENGMPSIALSLESASSKKPAKKRGRPPLLVKKGKKKSKIDISV